MDKAALVALAREKARVLYEGKRVAHRSCGIALAETFDVPSRSYQALRRGGIDGTGECGAVKAGELILGELLGDPEPAGAVTPRLRAAMARYHAEIAKRLDRGGSETIVCNDLTRPFPVFQGEERLAFCTGIAATVAEVLAETLLEFGATLSVSPIPAR
jgi:hypothetical protein